MSDYTPTTNRVRNSYANDIASYPKPANVFEAAARADSAKEEFDRWLAEHDRQVSEHVWDNCITDVLVAPQVEEDGRWVTQLPANPHRQERA